MSTTPSAPPELAAVLVVPHQKFSKLGVANFVLSIAGILLTLGLFAISGLNVARGQGQPAVTQHRLEVAGAYLLLVFAIDLTSIILGISSLFCRGLKRVFGVIGFSLSGAVLAGVVILAIIAHSWRAPSQGLVAAQGFPPPMESTLSNPLATAAPPQGWEGLPVYRIGLNDHAEVTIAATNGLSVSATAMTRLRDAIVRQFEDKQAENPPTDLAKQFLILVSVKKYGKVPNFPGSRDLDLQVDVRVLPGGERVCYFGVGEFASPELSDILLEKKAAADAAKCLSDPRMWIRPAKVDFSQPSQSRAGAKRDTSDNSAVPQSGRRLGQLG